MLYKKQLHVILFNNAKAISRSQLLTTKKRFILLFSISYLESPFINIYITLDKNWYKYIIKLNYLMVKINNQQIYKININLKIK